MARDYEDIFDVDDLSDDDLQSLIRAEFDSYDTIDADNILVRASGGVVELSGRVGTVEELRIAEHILTDVVGVKRFANNLVVDPIRRDEEPEAADESVGDELGRGEDQLGGSSEADEPPSARRLGQNLDADLYGTHDMRRAIEDGTSWEPPDTPTPEGEGGREPEIGPA